MSTTPVLDERVLQKAKAIAEMIASSEEVARYRQAEEKMNRHSEAQALLFNVKALRNRYSQTSLRLGDDHPETLKAKEAFDAVVERLSQIPVVEQFQEAQMELNDLLQGITKIIALTMEGFHVEWGKSDEITASCGSGGCSGGCASKGCAAV
jgi:cell fate (sporulation/competence/biofilm development) regulator YmcA (YheA/YmcA/DUF963 family)